MKQRENEWPPRKGNTENLAFRVLMVGLEGSLGRRRGRRAQEGRGTFQKEMLESQHGFHT